MTLIGSVETCVHNGHEKSFCKKTCKDIARNTIVNGDSLELLKCLSSETIDLVVTSPPYANKRIDSYGGVDADDYNDWFIPIAKEIKRVLKPSGSFVLNINDVVKNDVKHPYVYDLVRNLVDDGWKWIDTFVWVKSNPTPRQVTYRFKDGFEYIYHFSKSVPFKRDPRAVRVPMSETTKKIIESAKKRPDYDVRTYSVSGMNKKVSNLAKLRGKVLPSNVLSMGVSSNKTIHTAVFPKKLPEFFIKFLTDKGDVVLDPFNGSGTTAVVAKENCRHYIGFDKMPEYVGVAKKRIKEINNDHCGVLE